MISEGNGVKMIVVVDRRSEVAEAYKTTIGREGYSAISFDPEDFMSWFQTCPDIDLACVEGIVLGEFDSRESMTRSIKSRSHVPSIALSDTAALETTLKLFQAGADDVVRKPVHAKEIIARLSAIRRRFMQDQITQEQTSLWSEDGLTIYGDGRDPQVNGANLDLPRRERRILDYLAINRGRRLTRAQIFAAIYGVLEENVEECVVESHISKLRKKLRSHLGYDPIDTQRFLGYQLIGRMASVA